ncbi:MAG: hypothetical protein SGBAC_005031 [Bacillariaceae sp.]
MATTTETSAPANPLEASWTWGAGAVEESDEEEDNWESSKVSSNNSIMQASWGWGAGQLTVEDDEEEEGEWDFGHCKVQEDSPSQEEEEVEYPPGVPSAPSHQMADEGDDDWNFEHCKVASKDEDEDAQSATSVTYDDSISCDELPIIEEVKEAIRDGTFDNALEEARRSFEKRQSLRLSQMMTSGLPEEDGEELKKEDEHFNSSNFISLPNIAESQSDDEEPICASSWWTLSPSLSEVDDAVKSPSSSVKRKKKKKTARKSKIAGVAFSPLYSSISESSIIPEEDETASVKSSRKNKKGKSKSKSPKRSTKDKDNSKNKDNGDGDDDYDDASSVRSSKSKRKMKKRKSKSLSPARSSGNRKRIVDEKLDVVNKKLEQTVGLVSTPPRRRNKKAQQRTTIEECREEKRKMESKLMSSLGKIVREDSSCIPEVEASSSPQA